MSRSRNYQKSRKYRGRWFIKPKRPRDTEIFDGTREWYECEGDYWRFHQPEKFGAKRRSHFWRQYERFQRTLVTSNVSHYTYSKHYFKSYIYEAPERKRLHYGAPLTEQQQEIFHFFEVARTSDDD